jgi:hypothetical protein
MSRPPAPTPQLAGLRPIAFVLDTFGVLSRPVVLPIRPEDLTRTEPSRATVHQTMGRDVTGWVDEFGAGLPSVSISGTTGWRYREGVNMDGEGSFMALNKLVVEDYHRAKQTAIDVGLDPAKVKLIFVDMLDDFTWSVVPTQFQLRRSKSRPLLYQYQIQLQAVDVNIDTPLIALPVKGSLESGLDALDRVIVALGNLVGTIDAVVGRALKMVNAALAPIGVIVKKFVALSTAVFSLANAAVRGAKNLVVGAANNVIGIARDLATVGQNIFRTFNAIANLPGDIKGTLIRVASAFNEVRCIFANSLRSRQTYQNYTGLYGASNCSSTTGGRQDSPYANMNAFSLMQPEPNAASLNTEALSSVRSLSQMDPVLAPMPIPEVGRNVQNVVTGLAL